MRRGKISALCLLYTLACGGRSDRYDLSFSDDDALGLRHAIVLGDDPLQRVVVAQTDGVGELRTRELPVGQHRVSMLPDVSGPGSSRATSCPA
ncbi:MAG: hypothetical protein ABI895_08180 [Deltaproteobacteria bacterium]